MGEGTPMMWEAVDCELYKGLLSFILKTMGNHWEVFGAVDLLIIHYKKIIALGAWLKW